jgi:hypothetical protein
MRILNLSDQVFYVNNTQIDIRDLTLMNDFNGTLKIGTEVLSYDTDTYEIIAVNSGGGLLITNSEMPEIPYWGVAGLMVFVVGVSLLIKIVQKVKLAR